MAVAGPFIVPPQPADTVVSQRQVSSENVPPLRNFSFRILVKTWSSRAAESLFTVLFPSDCRICKIPLVEISRLPVCQQCIHEMLPLQGRTCMVCGERVLSIHAAYADDGSLHCPLCSQVERPFARAVAYGSYQDGLRELIHLLKYGGVRPAANVLGRMLAEAMNVLEPGLHQTDLSQTDSSQLSLLQTGLLLAGSEQQKIPVIPVPLHKTRLRQRGFNQAELIARAALKVRAADGSLVHQNFVLMNNVLQRKRETQSQIGLTSQQRRANMRGAFAVTRSEEVTGREVLLVDDVYTTGTTASECARVLRKAGASRVWVVTVARTLKIASNYSEDDVEELIEEQTKEASSELEKAPMDHAV